MVTDSVAAGSVFVGNNAGFFVQGLIGSSKPVLTVTRSAAAFNDIGLRSSGANATLRVGQSTVTGNMISTSLETGGILQSFGDNYIAGNSDGDPAPPTIAKK